MGTNSEADEWLAVACLNFLDCRGCKPLDQSFRILQKTGVEFRQI
jgi:hypothetical protein